MVLQKNLIRKELHYLMSANDVVQFVLQYTLVIVAIVGLCYTIFSNNDKK